MTLCHILPKRRGWVNRTTEAEYAVDIGLLKNTPAQAETQLQSLERVAGGIYLHVNAEKTEYRLFNQRGDISTLKSGIFKLEDRFTNLGSSISSIKNDIDT